MIAATSVFMSGNSQAIRLPKAFRVKSKRVQLEAIEGGFIVREQPETMQAFLDQLPYIPDAPLLEPEPPEPPIEAWR